MALRHDAREFRRRWLVRVDAWCTSLRGGAVTLDEQGSPIGRTRGVIESVLAELAEIGEPPDSPLTRETRSRLELACRASAEEHRTGAAAPGSTTESEPRGIQPLELRVVPAPIQPRGRTA